MGSRRTGPLMYWAIHHIRCMIAGDVLCFILMITFLQQCKKKIKTNTKQALFYQFLDL